MGTVHPVDLRPRRRPTTDNGRMGQLFEKVTADDAIERQYSFVEFARDSPQLDTMNAAAASWRFPK